MATRNVVLTDQQEKLVSELVTRGRFQNAIEVLRAGIRLLEYEEAIFADLRSRLNTGLQQARAGEYAAGTGADAIKRAFER